MPPPSRQPREQIEQQREQIEQQWWDKQLGHDVQPEAAADDDETAAPDADSAETPRPALENRPPAHRVLPSPLPVSLTQPETDASAAPKREESPPAHPELPPPLPVSVEAPHLVAQPERQSPSRVEQPLPHRISPTERVVRESAPELARDLLDLFREHATQLAGYLLVVLLGVVVGWIAFLLGGR